MKRCYIKVTYHVGEEVKVKESSVPFTPGQAQRFPDEEPFNRNYYLSADDGFSLRTIYFPPSGNQIEYCTSTVMIVDNKAYLSPFKHELYTFEFEIKDED